jgi:4-hydroxybenzoate polyprenyltransferase
MYPSNKPQGVSRYVSAYVQLVDVSAMQRPMIAIGLGMACSSGQSLSTVVPPIINLIFAFAGMVLILAHIMTLNDYFDVEIDKEKYPNPAVSVVGRKAAGVLAMIFLSTGLLFSWLASTLYFTISLAIVLLSMAYSAPPIQYKYIYPFSTVGEAIGAFLLFWAGYSLFAPLDVRAIVVSLIPFLLLMIGRLKHEIHYVNFDKVSGKKTFAVVHGVHKVKLLVRFLIFIIIALTIGSLFIGWFSAGFLFFLLISLCLIAVNSMSSSINKVWLKGKLNFYWGFIFFLLVAVWLL